MGRRARGVNYEVRNDAVRAGMRMDVLAAWLAVMTEKGK